ncbi:hypothetical protein HPP92_028049 [Vanilla planifolia]|uniref:SHSP domain-containing protein n=1 Tax=Vanilla planifolia TaxID=51239 RepID=A0A835PA68_VANPL|nr:hypothetical protein HPP92_028049 [Vanilla planifolia]
MANYEDFQPITEWTSDGTTDTLIVRLPGFNKEQLKVQIDNYGKLRTSGERPLVPGQVDRWIRFKTEHSIPDDCDLRGIRARFEDSVLYVNLPKSIKEEQTNMPESKVPEPEPERKPVPQQKQDREETQEAELNKRKENKVEEEDSGEQRGLHKDEVKEDDGGEAGAAPLLGKRMPSLVEGFRRPNQLVVNMMVAAVVFVVIAVYVAYKLRSGGREEKSEGNLGRLDL